VVVTGLTALVFTVAPLTTILRGGHAALLRATSTRTTRQRGRIERAGVFVQCALVVVLLASAALLVRTHRELLAVDVGFRATNLLSVRFRFLPPVTRYRDAESRRALLEELTSKVAGLPGVEAATMAYAVPFQAVSGTDIQVAASSAVSEGDDVAGTYVIAGPTFFQTMGIAVRAGRLFERVDDGPGTAAIVSETFARRHWPNASAIGQRIRVDDVWRNVVGVVADVRHASVDEALRSTFYLPAAQAGQRLPDAIVLRTSGDPRQLVAAVRRVVSAQDPALPITRADRLSDLIGATLVAERFRTVLLSVFAATAVLLAAIGVVGVTTNAGARRRRELAIRMAVGAAPAGAVRLVLSGAVMVGVAGAGTGVAVAQFATRALRPFLYGVSPADPGTYAVVLLLVVCVSLMAAWVPARRAVRMDLMRALSSD
jgi:predicted permease